MRIYVLSVAVLFSYLPVNAVDGFDQPGFDYANFNADSPAVCRNTCGGESRCQAWTWVKPGIQGAAGHCWLKYKLPKLVKNSCCNSGSRQNISARDLTAEDHTNRPGFDYKNFDTDSWKTCQSACAADQQCAAWSYTRPGTQKPQPHCWLKVQVPHPVNDAAAISGVKFRPPSVRFD
jgi:hypothetical protein